MADQESTEATVNEEIQDTEVEESLESDDTSFEDFDDEDTEESESDEQNEDDADTDQQDEEEESEADADDQEEPDESQEEDGKHTDVELSEEEQRKEHNRQMAERRIAEKQQRQAAIEDQQRAYIEQSQEAYDRAIERGLTEEEANAEAGRDAALRQLQVESYNNTVEKNTNNLTNAYQRAANDFEILRSENPRIKAEVDQAIDAFQAMHVRLDQYGNPVQVSGDLYTFLKDKSESIAELTSIGMRDQAKKKSVEKSKTFTRPVTAPQKPKSDPDLDGFDEEASRW